MVSRRAWLHGALPAWLCSAPLTAGHAASVQRGAALQFPRDHGAHLGARIEWWYFTGCLLKPGGEPSHGFQLTFFRHATGLAENLPGRFAPRQVLLAHAALTDLTDLTHLTPAPGSVHRSASRAARWTGAAQAPLAAAATHDARVHLGNWWLQRRDGSPSVFEVSFSVADVELTLSASATQPPLLQGDAGWSQKGPQPDAASHYVSEPQLRLSGHMQRGGGRGGKSLSVQGLGWLDHEWSDELVPAGAVGWDWTGINLADGSALTAFRLRRADGSALWGGGSFRSATGATQNFAAATVRFEPGLRWRSPRSSASYPVHWQVHTPAGTWQLRALTDDQEMDGRTSLTGHYWEGLSELLDAQGRRAGLGYLEMTGYAAPLAMP